MAESKTTNTPLKYVLMTDQAFKPTKGSILSAGLDLYAAYGTTIPAKGKGIVRTDLKMAMPEGHYGRIAPRSGLAARKFIDVGGGVIDADYRGEIRIILFNFGQESFRINRGAKIAQLICEKISHPELEECSELEETERNEGGFGSTGSQSHESMDTSN